MSWFSELAGRAETLLNNIDEQTGAALRNRNGVKKKYEMLTTIDTNANRRPPSPARNRSSLTQKKSPVRPSKEQVNKAVWLPQPQTNKTLPRKPFSTWKDTEPQTEVSRSFPVNPDTTELQHKERRHSFPSELIRKQSRVFRIFENLEEENKLLKNELQMLTRDLNSLVMKLESVQNGEDVVSESDKLSVTHKKLLETEGQKENLFVVNKSLASQLDHLQNQIETLHSAELAKYKHEVEAFQTQVDLLKIQNQDLEKEIGNLKRQCSEREKGKEKLEVELRHANNTITELTSELDKAYGECKRLEKDWESYKLRVKGMLSAKDKEIKKLQEGVIKKEDTKVLIEEIENLKEERDQLQEQMNKMHSKFDDLRSYVSSVEDRHASAERMVAALREALKDERAARNRAEVQYNAAAKELKNIQIEANQTISSLRSSLREKERELKQLRESELYLATSDTSVLNVADYDLKERDAENEKIHYLTQQLMQKQETIDSLLADKQTLRIQLQNVESKYKREKASPNPSDSVVSLQEDSRLRLPRPYQSEPLLFKFSRRLSIWIRTHPLFRIFIIVYVISLQMWVFTILLTSTPDVPMTKPKII